MNCQQLEKQNIIQVTHASTPRKIALRSDWSSQAPPTGERRCQKGINNRAQRLRMLLGPCSISKCSCRRDSEVEGCIRSEFFSTVQFFPKNFSSEPKKVHPIKVKLDFCVCEKKFSSARPSILENFEISRKDDNWQLQWLWLCCKLKKKKNNFFYSSNGFDFIYFIFGHNNSRGFRISFDYRKFNWPKWDQTKPSWTFFTCAPV